MTLPDDLLTDDFEPELSGGLKAPFPYFGGKSKAAALIWERLGADVPNYVEPFGGSLAVLLGRPQTGRIETVNDFDGFLSNAWRAIRADPDGVAYYAARPVVEADLHAIHLRLISAREGLTERLMGDIDYYDTEMAGWWIWGLCNWIGGGWCDGSGPWVSHNGVMVRRQDIAEGALLAVPADLPGVSRQLPALGNSGRGVNRQVPEEEAGIRRKLPRLCSTGLGVNGAEHNGPGGVSRQLPALGDAGRGVNRKLPHLANAGKGVSRRLPHLGDGGRGVSRGSLAEEGDEAQGSLVEWMRALSARLSRVRVACGDWSRVTGESVTTRHGITGVVLDPPYDDTGADNAVYGTAYDGSIAAQVRAWAVEAGKNPMMRIVYCSYGDTPMPDDWVRVPWHSRKGYQKVDEQGRHNGQRETLFFSPHCLVPRAPEEKVNPQGTLW